ncbi:laccase-12 isoform X2 [Solenopsis invicta]|uniref:laccase-12 isoform X2 n=1 Tax=Solenopsis invicta TaxID=13686 RepID=UPI00193E97B6|nr:laccase-12 isoform X2 [Solenopsis invicta]
MRALHNKGISVNREISSLSPLCHLCKRNLGLAFTYFRILQVRSRLAMHSVPESVVGLDSRRIARTYVYVRIRSTQIFWAIMSCFRYCIVLMFVSCSILVSGLSVETFDDGYHECMRSCSDDPSSKKTCFYNFIITESHGVTSFYNKLESNGDVSRCTNVTTRRSFLTINGKSPGPAIQVCLGDTIEVLVHNKLGSDELTLHWHGIRQKDNYMDGVPMITQCPILPFGGFRYKIIPESAGTYFYHAHSVSQQGDGVYGSLTVRGPRDEDPGLERTLVLSSRPSTPLTRHASLLSPPTPGELLVNGQAREVVVRVRHGSRYLLRLVNANVHDCPVLLSAHGHSLQILAADGNLVQSMMGTHVVLFPGERLDGILTADQAIGKYVLDIQGLQECRNLHQEAYIFYEDAGHDSDSKDIIRIVDADNFDAQSFKIAESGHDCHKISKNVICSLDLKSRKLLQLKEKADETIYVPFDANAFSFFTDEMTDNSYNFYKSKYYPAYLSLKPGTIRIPQINGMSFKYPPSPILSQPENTLEKMICSLDKRSSECADTPLFCECLQLLQVPPRKIIEIILINKGFGGNASYTFHLHGYNASIIGRDSFKQPFTKDEFMSLDLNGKIHRNLKNPVQKDTFVVPNKGYIILRFYTDNLGYWLWEARSTAVYSPLLGPGMQFLMRVGLQRNLPLVPIDFPNCGNNKGMDLIFENA